MAKTQKNKATNAHLGILKAKLAKLRRELITPKSGGKVAGEGFDVAKTGDARVGFVGKFYLKKERKKILFVINYFIRKKKFIFRQV